MKQLSEPQVTPPGGWRYVDPDTGFKFRRLYRTLDELVKHVARYRAHNGLSRIPKLRMVIEAWLCEQPGMEGRCREVSVVDRTLSQYLRGAKAAAQVWLQGDRAFVPTIVAETRAAMCVECRHNKRSNKDSALRHYTDEYVQEIVGERKTSVDDKLFSCEICSCPLRPKVHISQQIVQNSLSKTERRLLSMGLWNIKGELFDCWQVKPVLVLHEGGKDGEDQ